MPKVHVKKSKRINAPIEKIYDAVADMGQWAAWSPWLIMEPDAKITTAPDQQSYEWDGERVGAGHMAVTDARENQSVRYDLTFLRPFKSHAKVGFDLKQEDDGVDVTWTMDSQLPFFMFFMKKMMITFIGMDYERGLNLLQDYCEDGKIHSRLDFTGKSEYPGSNYIGIKRSCTIEEMPQLMGEDFKRLTGWAAQNGLNPEDSMAIYHDFKPVKGTCSFTSAVRYTEKPASIPGDFITGSQPPATIYSIEHTGPYRHLGNMWAAMQNMLQSKTVKPVKNYHPFETYLNSPMDTAENDLITRVNFAVK